MKKTLLLSYALILLVPSMQRKTVVDDHRAEALWNGTISYVQTQTVHHAGPYSETIYKKWDHFFEQRMDATCTNSKGIATSTIQLVDTSYYREQIGPRTLEQWEDTKGTAQGKDNTEVSIYIDQAHKTYNIEVPIPETEGNKTKTFICKGCGQPASGPITSTMGEDATMIQIEEEKLGPNPDLLTGEKVERKKIDNGEGEEVTITRWKFTRVK